MGFERIVDTQRCCDSGYFIGKLFSVFLHRLLKAKIVVAKAVGEAFAKEAPHSLGWHDPVPASSSIHVSRNQV